MKEYRIELCGALTVQVTAESEEALEEWLGLQQDGSTELDLEELLNEAVYYDDNMQVNLIEDC